MGRTACTEPQCLYKGALYLLPFNIEIAEGHWGGQLPPSDVVTMEEVEQEEESYTESDGAKVNEDVAVLTFLSVRLYECYKRIGFGQETKRRWLKHHHLMATNTPELIFIVAPCMLLRLFLLFQLMHLYTLKKSPIHINPYPANVEDRVSS